MTFRLMKKNAARRLGFGLFFVLFTASSATSQTAPPTSFPPTNIEIYQNLALECLTDAALPDSFRLADSRGAPYIRGALVAHWLDEGRTVYADDTTSTATPSRLSFEADRQAVRYEREGKRIRRHVELGLRYEVIAADRRLTAASRCDLTHTDVLDRSHIQRIDDGRYAATTAELPPASWRRRYLEPVIVGAATAVTVVLFFTLRSKRTSAE